MIGHTRSSQASPVALSLYFTAHETAYPTLSCRLYQRAAIFANIFAIAVAYAIAIYGHVYVYKHMRRARRVHKSFDSRYEYPLIRFLVRFSPHRAPRGAAKKLVENAVVVVAVTTTYLRN